MNNVTTKHKQKPINFVGNVDSSLFEVKHLAVSDTSNLGFSKSGLGLGVKKFLKLHIYELF